MKHMSNELRRVNANSVSSTSKNRNDFKLIYQRVATIFFFPVVFTVINLIDNYKTT